MTTDALHAEGSYQRAGRSALCVKQDTVCLREKERGIKTHGKN